LLTSTSTSSTDPAALARNPMLLHIEATFTLGGGDAYAAANPQNFRRVLNPSRLLLGTFTLDSALILALVREGIKSDDYARDQMKHVVAVPANSTFPFSVTADSDLLWRGALYVLDFKDLQLLLLQTFHDHHLTRHPGIHKMLHNVRSRYWWPNLVSDITQYIWSCDACCRVKPIHHKLFSPLCFLPVLERSWSSISMDFIEGLPVSDGFDMILVIVDRLTKMGLFIPCHSTADTLNLADMFLQNVFAKHGTSDDIVSDRGKHFVSWFWSSLCNLLHIKSNLSTTYHLETDGQTEHVNQILEQYLRLYVNYQQDDWSSLLPLVEFAYNNTPHSATSITPFFANKGFNPKLDIGMDSMPSAAAAQMATDLSALHVSLRERIWNAITQYATATVGRHAPIPPFEVGELVWLDAHHIRTTRLSKKVDHKHIRPFSIIEKVSTHAHCLALLLALRNIHNVFHMSLLEPHTPNPFSTHVPSTSAC
jgi:hypothetical protein